MEKGEELRMTSTRSHSPILLTRDWISGKDGVEVQERGWPKKMELGTIANVMSTSVNSCLSFHQISSDMRHNRIHDECTFAVMSTQPWGAIFFPIYPDISLKALAQNYSSGRVVVLLVTSQSPHVGTPAGTTNLPPKFSYDS